MVADMSQPGERKVLLRGGQNGFGVSASQRPRQAPISPSPASRRRVFRLELKTIADVGLVEAPAREQRHHPLPCSPPARPGSPTITSPPCAQSGRRPALLKPGHLAYSRPRRGASERGPGARLPRHVERTRLLLHVVDASGGEARPAGGFPHHQRGAGQVRQAGGTPAPARQASSFAVAASSPVDDAEASSGRCAPGRPPREQKAACAHMAREEVVPQATPRWRPTGRVGRPVSWRRAAQVEAWWWWLAIFGRKMTQRRDVAACPLGNPVAIAMIFRLQAQVPMRLGADARLGSGGHAWALQRWLRRRPRCARGRLHAPLVLTHRLC